MCPFRVSVGRSTVPHLPRAPVNVYVAPENTHLLLFTADLPVIKMVLICSTVDKVALCPLQAYFHEILVLYPSLLGGVWCHVAVTWHVHGCEHAGCLFSYVLPVSMFVCVLLMCSLDWLEVILC